MQHRWTAIAIGFVLLGLASRDTARAVVLVPSVDFMLGERAVRRAVLRAALRSSTGSIRPLTLVSITAWEWNFRSWACRRIKCWSQPRCA